MTALIEVTQIFVARCEWKVLIFLVATVVASAGATGAQPVQPSPETLAIISDLPSIKNGARSPSDFAADELLSRRRNVVFSGSLPYFPYYALNGDAQFVFHPMALGRFLKDNAESEIVGRFTDAAVKSAYKLPNGGLAWYYPKHYRVSRMQGPYLRYSAISQGTILAGLTEVGRTNPEIGFGPARRAFQAMQWPLEKGGVNFADKALLEMPSFMGPPEIILNGWIDALLHLSDYAQVTGDEDAKELLSSNFKFLAKVLPKFDAGDISRYSDVSPYRLRVTLDAPKFVDTLHVEYRPRLEGLPTYSFDLPRTSDSEDWSPYDNQIWRQNGRVAHIWVSCSQLYETVVVSASPHMTIELDAGVVDRKRATPGFGGRKITITAEPAASGSSLSLDAAGDDLICGYPTNFSKGGKHNYYHVYHVIGLLLLAIQEGVGETERSAFTHSALKWFDDMKRLEGSEGLEFMNPQDVLRLTRGNQLTASDGTFAQLLETARARQ